MQGVYRSTGRRMAVAVRRNRTAGRPQPARPVSTGSTTSSSGFWSSWWTKPRPPVRWKTQSLKRCLKAARNGDARAQRVLGRIYLEGLKGVTPNDTEAFRWYLTAASNGDVNAQVKVAHLYSDGRGVGRDLDEARKWYSAAAINGNHALAKYVLGLMIERGIGGSCDRLEAVRLFEDAARMGIVDAQEKIADMYFDGTMATLREAQVQQNGNEEEEAEEFDAIEQAMFWYEKAAGATQSAHSLSRLGLIHYNGLNGQVDKTKAMSLWTAAATQGHAHTQYLLGLFGSSTNAQEPTKRPSELPRATDDDQPSTASRATEEPEPTLISSEVIYNYPTKASTGSMSTAAIIGHWYRKMRSYQKAFDALLPAAMEGDTKAQVELGKMFEKGEGVDVNIGEARKWFELAAVNGEARAQYALGKLYEERRIVEDGDEGEGSEEEESDEDGDGFGSDDVVESIAKQKAKYWYQQAGNLLYPKAIVALEQLQRRHHHHQRHLQEA